MSRSSFLRYAVALAALASGALAARQAEAQSLFAARGLGLVVEPIDARSQGLGGVALGLPGSDILWSSPAEAVGLGAPGLVVAYQFDSFSADFGAGSTEGTTARFPLVLGAFPAGERWVFTAGYGGFLDQNWAAERVDTLVVGADTFGVVDRFRSTGGAGRLRLGAGYRVMETLAAGVGIDLFTGSVELTAARTFPGELEPRLPTAAWNYRGVGLHGGAAWRPTEAFSLSVAGSTGGTLEARSQVAGTPDASYGLPSTANVGASGQIGPDLLVALSADWAGWSGLDAPLAATGGARDSWSVQGGVEWDALEIRDRPLPLRLGARQGALPFRWRADPGGDWANERALTAGVGLLLAGGANRFDAALERGTRGGAGGGLEESFWRFALSVRVLGR
jgi:hypothetical protein